ncbi:MAG: hypothetical protein U0R70_17490 [Solirubrobacteraceae bacterium]
MTKTLTHEDEDRLALAATQQVWAATQEVGWLPNCCIGACRTLQEVLRSVGIAAKPQVVETTVANAAYMQEAGRLGRAPQSTAEVDAMVRAGGYIVEIGGRGSGRAPSRNGWQGHLVLLTDRLVLDPTLAQATRPAKSIVLMPLAWEHGGRLPHRHLSGMFADCAVSIVPRVGDRSYVASPDWRLHSGHRVVAARVIDNMAALKQGMLADPPVDSPVVA